MKNTLHALITKQLSIHYHFFIYVGKLTFILYVTHMLSFVHYVTDMFHSAEHTAKHIKLSFTYLFQEIFVALKATSTSQYITF